MIYTMLGIDKIRRNRIILEKIFSSKIIILVFLLWTIFFLSAGKWNAIAQEEEIDKKIEELEQKAKDYQRIINLKQQQQTTLKNQIELMDVEIEKLENYTQLLEKEIEKLEKEEDRIERELIEKEKFIQTEKKKLEELIQFFNQIDRDLKLEFLANKGDLTKIFTQTELLDQTSQKIGEILEKYQEEKFKFEKKKEELSKKIDEIKNKQEELKAKRGYLNNEKNSKRILLEETLGEETRYQKLLERIEKQKQELIGDIDALSDKKKKELEKIKAEAPKPKSKLASTNWYYSQKDRRWAYNRIGLSSSLMKDYGCAVTSLAMVFTYHKEKITPGELAAKPIFYRDLIVWPNYWGNLNLVSSTTHGSVNWKTVDKALEENNLVIVFVRAVSGKGHYVVIHNKDNRDYIVHDPLFGDNIYLGTTRKLVAAIYNQKSTLIDQIIIYEKK